MIRANTYVVDRQKKSPQPQSQNETLWQILRRLDIDIRPQTLKETIFQLPIKIGINVVNKDVKFFQHVR